MASQPPLSGIRVLEFAGLAPGPYAGLLLADYGASVLRIDRPAAPGAANRPTSDLLTRFKASIALDLKSHAAITFFKNLLPHVDVVIDPFRPGVLEKLGLSPEEVMLKINPRLVVARMTGFRRDGKYSQMAGHDINYIAVSGVLSMLGRSGEKPHAPGNLLGDFAGGGAVCFMGILLALLSREKTGKGQVVGANMVDGAAHLATWLRLETKGPRWAQPRGKNLLDGGSPFYDTYETSDGKFMAVGALEPQFFAALLKGMSLAASDLPGDRNDPSTWPKLRDLFTKIFKSKTRYEWEQIFDGTDACCTPVLTQRELEENGYEQRPIVTLQNTPGLAIAGASGIVEKNINAIRGQGAGVTGGGWVSQGLRPGDGGERLLRQWTGLQQGKSFVAHEDKSKSAERSKL